MVLIDDIIVRVGKHQKILADIFTRPTKGSIRWDDARSLLEHLGAVIEEGAGSRVRVELRGMRAVFHRPHPSPNMKKSLVDAVREFLHRAGVNP